VFRVMTKIPYTGSGTLTGLRTTGDINGIFTAVGTGLTLGGGASIAEMRNEHGVAIQLDSTTEGLSVSLAAKGVEVSIADRGTGREASRANRNRKITGAVFKVLS
jgi:hypothetical protein